MEAYIICKECGEKIVARDNGKALWKLNHHIKKCHKMNSKEYVIKHEYKGKEPNCACGCGKEVIFSKWKFNKYYYDHIKNVKWTDEQKDKMRQTVSKKSHLGYKKLGLTKEDLEKYWELYQTKEFNKEKLYKISGVDPRTIEKYWVMLKIAQQKEINRYKKLHQFKWSNEGNKNGAYKEIPICLIDDIIEFLLEKPRKWIEIKTIFNVSNYTKALIEKRLKERYGSNSIIEKIISGNSSNEELEFLTILRWFFGKNNIKHQFKLERKIYDFLLFNKLIIEYDGTYWHSQKSEFDEKKDEIAKKAGYHIFRISDKEAKFLNILQKIKEKLDELQISIN